MHPSAPTLTTALEHPTVVRLSERLAARRAVATTPWPEARLAAVAAVLRITHEPELLFIKRAEQAGDPWSGHMAFPGGRHEAVDVSLEHTAVRETREEVDVDLVRDGHVLGVLDDLAPRSRHLPPIIVRPFVAVVRADVAPSISHEVASYFWVPLGALRDPSAAGEHRMHVDGVGVRFPGYRIGPHLAWGLTERIVRQLLGLLDD